MYVDVHFSTPAFRAAAFLWFCVKRVKDTLPVASMRFEIEAGTADPSSITNIRDTK
jgi:hypothetical protein